MAFSVNTNNEAASALRLLNQTNKGLSDVQSRINSGLKIAGARDNASTFAIAAGIRSDVSLLQTVSDSLSLGVAVGNTAVSGATRVLQKLDELADEAAKAKSPTADRAAIQKSIDEKLKEIDSIVSSSQFNGVNLLNGTGNQNFLASINRTSPTAFTTADITLTGTDLTAATLNVDGVDVTTGSGAITFGPAFAGEVADAETITITAGGQDFVFEFIDDLAATGTTAASNFAVEFDAGDDQGTIVNSLIGKLKEAGFTASYNELGQLQISGNGLGATGDGIAVSAGLTDTTGTVTAAGDPDQALVDIEAARTVVKDALSTLAATTNSLEAQKDFTVELKDTLEAAVGVLVDADLAEESARLQSLQTKQQLGIQALSIANQGPGAVLTLFRG